jgi:hypothetical protein
MRVMRRNYDKPHRCPGWSGPALKAGRLDGIDGDKCGYLAPRGEWSEERFRSLDGPDSWNSYGLVRCPGCKTWVLPYWMRYVDPTYLTWKIRRAIKEARQ